MKVARCEKVLVKNLLEAIVFPGFAEPAASSAWVTETALWPLEECKSCSAVGDEVLTFC